MSFSYRSVLDVNLELTQFGVTFNYENKLTHFHLAFAQFFLDLVFGHH